MEHFYDANIDETTIKITFGEEKDFRRDIIEKILKDGLRLLEISKEIITLDEIFSKITGE
jgi:hypothetical protein